MPHKKERKDCRDIRVKFPEVRVSRLVGGQPTWHVRVAHCRQPALRNDTRRTGMVGNQFQAH